METQKEMYEKSIRQSQLKQGLISQGITKYLESCVKHESIIDIDYIQECFKVLEAEKSTCDFYNKMLNDLVSGELQKREEAKAKLGIK